MNGNFNHSGPVIIRLIGLFKGGSHLRTIGASYARKFQYHHALVEVTGTDAERLRGLVVIFCDELHGLVRPHGKGRAVEVVARSHVLNLGGSGHIGALVQYGKGSGLARLQARLVYHQAQLCGRRGLHRHLDRIGGQVPVLGGKLELAHIARRYELIGTLCILLTKGYIRDSRSGRHVLPLIGHRKGRLTEAVADNRLRIHRERQRRCCHGYFVGCYRLTAFRVFVGSGESVRLGSRARERGAFDGSGTVHDNGIGSNVDTLLLRSVFHGKSSLVASVGHDGCLVHGQHQFLFTRFRPRAITWCITSRQRQRCSHQYETQTFECFHNFKKNLLFYIVWSIHQNEVVNERLKPV